MTATVGNGVAAKRAQPIQKVLRASNRAPGRTPGKAAGQSSSLVSRNVYINGHRTSIRLEPAMWDGLEEIAKRESISLHQVCSQVRNSSKTSGFTAAVRVYVMAYFKDAATELGHARAGHGRLNGNEQRV